MANLSLAVRLAGRAPDPITTSAAQFARLQAEQYAALAEALTLSSVRTVLAEQGLVQAAAHLLPTPSLAAFAAHFQTPLAAFAASLRSPREVALEELRTALRPAVQQLSPLLSPFATPPAPDEETTR